MSARSLGATFFARKAPVVARELLGAWLVRRVGKKTSRYRIVETEAYDGFRDMASHAARGKTARNEVMFGHPGRWYIYFVYGMHNMLNIVCGPIGYPSAVLIRAVEKNNQGKTLIIGGPGRLTKEMGITRALNKKPASKTSGLWIERGARVPSSAILRAPRIGIFYAGEKWANKKWRFVLKT